jgi:plastocyanin
MTLTMTGIIFGIQNLIFATTGYGFQGERPNINASTVFNTHTMIPGNNIKNFAILIPNEAHESTNQPKDQYPLIKQPYVPQNIVIPVGTAVTWLNGDVDHDHKITLVNSQVPNASAVIERGVFAYNTATTPIIFNETGEYSYFEKDINDNDPNFIMNGTIKVINQPQQPARNTLGVTADTIGTFMVPAKDLDLYISELNTRGITTDSTHTFKDLRGGQKGTGPEQALIVWTSSGKNLDEVLAALEEISPNLPYS